MSYFDDLTPYVYFDGDLGPPALNIGWLDAAHAFVKGPSTSQVRDRLWAYSRVIVNPTRGLHACEFCVNRRHAFERHGELLLLGAGELRVVGADGSVFAAPNLLYHYVTDHEYSPPGIFMDALEFGPAPSSHEYAKSLSARHVDWRVNPPVPEAPRPFRWVRTEEGFKKVFDD